MELNEVSKTDNTSLLSVAETEEMLIWLEQFTLSRPTKKINRDFSDAVLLAEILKVHYPKFVEMHNYPPRNSQAQKLNNWMTINRKVLKKLKLNICIKTMEQLANSMPGVIERVLVMVREKIKRDEESNKNLEKGENTLSSGGSCYETCGEEEQVFIVPIKRRSGDVLEKIQKKVVSYDAYICLKEELRDAKEAVEALKQKADHFEEIIKLKNIQITDLQKQVDKKAGKKRDETKEQITGAIENTSLLNQSVSDPGSSRGSVVEVYLSKSEAICKEDLNQTESEIQSLETPLPVKTEVVKQDIKVENNA